MTKKLTEDQKEANKARRDAAKPAKKTVAKKETKATETSHALPSYHKHEEAPAPKAEKIKIEDVDISLFAEKKVKSDYLKAKIVPGRDLSSVEEREVKTLLSKNDTTKSSSLGSVIASTELFAVAKHNGNVYGVAALRTRDASYISKLAGRASLADDALDSTSLEFGYFRLADTKKDRGFEKSLAESLTKAASQLYSDRKIFAVYDADNTYMNNVLTSAGFTRHERTHAALKGDKRIQLWLLTEN